MIWYLNMGIMISWRNWLDQQKREEAIIIILLKKHNALFEPHFFYLFCKWLNIVWINFACITTFTAKTSHIQHWLKQHEPTECQRKVTSIFKIIPHKIQSYGKLDQSFIRPFVNIIFQFKLFLINLFSKILLKLLLKIIWLNWRQI